VARELQERDLILIVHKTRDDIPDELAQRHLPEDLLSAAHQPDGSMLVASVPSTFD